MTSFRMSVTVLAVMHAVFAGFTALVGAFANGGDVWQRLLVVLLHPLGAAGVLVLVLRPRLATTTILALAALLTVNVIADLGLAQLMAAGRVRGDWELALAFSVVPVIGVVYALALLRTARAERSGKAQSGSGSLNRLMSAAAIPRWRRDNDGAQPFLCASCPRMGSKN